MLFKEQVKSTISKLEKSVVFKFLQLCLIFSWMFLLFETDSFFICYAICGFCAAVAVVLNRNAESIEKSVYMITSAFSAVFSVLVFLANYGLFLPYRESFFEIILTLCGGYIVAQNVLLLLYRRLPAIGVKVAPKATGKQLVVFLIPFVVYSTIYLLYLYLSAYPGNLSPDSVSQLEQAVDEIISNHHPVWHTLFIRAIVNIGLSLFGNITEAVALYSVCQLLFLSAAFSFSLMTLYMAGVKIRYLVLCGLPFAIMPYHIAYSVTMWKDVVFGAAALFLVSFLFRSIKNIGNKVVNGIFLFLFVVLFCVWRSNAWLAMVASVVFFFFYLNKKNLKLILIITAAVIVSWVMRSPVLSMADIPQPDFVESLSIPLQQVARVITNDGHLTEEDYELLDKIMDAEDVKKQYLSYLSDPIKAEVRSKNWKYLEENKTEYLKLWVRIGLRNPGSYVKAWVDQTKGYYNSGYSYWIFHEEISRNDLNLVREPQDNAFDSFVDDAVLDLQNNTLASPFISIGLAVWLLTAMGITAFLKRREELILYVPIIMIVATLLVATPVFSEFRYVYSVFTTLPFLLAIGIHNFTIDEGEIDNG